MSLLWSVLPFVVIKCRFCCVAHLAEACLSGVWKHIRCNRFVLSPREGIFQRPRAFGSYCTGLRVGPEDEKAGAIKSPAFFSGQHGAPASLGGAVGPQWDGAAPGLWCPRTQQAPHTSPGRLGKTEPGGKREALRVRAWGSESTRRKPARSSGGVRLSGAEGSSGSRCHRPVLPP